LVQATQHLTLGIRSRLHSWLHSALHIKLHGSLHGSLHSGCLLVSLRSQIFSQARANARESRSGTPHRTGLAVRLTGPPLPLRKRRKEVLSHYEPGQRCIPDSHEKYTSIRTSASKNPRIGRGRREGETWATYALRAARRTPSVYSSSFLSKSSA